MYSPAVLDHFKNPRNTGELEEASARVEVSNPVCGDVLVLSARVATGQFQQVRFLARGCVTAIACGSLLAEMLEGRGVDEARAITGDQISEALGGLPRETRHGAQLACDALEALLAKLDETAKA